MEIQPPAATILGFEGSAALRKNWRPTRIRNSLFADVLGSGVLGVRVLGGPERDFLHSCDLFTKDWVSVHDHLVFGIICAHFRTS